MELTNDVLVLLYDMLVPQAWNIGLQSVKVFDSFEVGVVRRDIIVCHPRTLVLGQQQDKENNGLFWQCAIPGCLEKNQVDKGRRDMLMQGWEKCGVVWCGVLCCGVVRRVVSQPAQEDEVWSR